MQRKPRVFLLTNKDFNLDSAKVYGDLQVLYETQPHDIFSTSKHAFNIKQKLHDMNSSDYLIVGGNIILVLIAFGVIYEKYGFVNLLLFDVKSQSYTARVLPKHQLQGGGNG